MLYKELQYADISVTLKFARFTAKETTECHALVEYTDVLSTAEAQFKAIEEGLQRFQKSIDLQDCTLIWKRYFVSDAINQASFLPSSVNHAVSIVQQPPLNGTKVALFAYFVSSAEMEKQPEGSFLLKRKNYNHLFHTQLHSRTGNVEEQTQTVFKECTQAVANNGYTLKENTIRTWIYVQDVDVQYAGMVVARNHHFDKEGLTSETHSIASTGIEGRYIYPEVLMLMEAYSVLGMQQEQINYLYAPTHLNPTHEYNVRFERGTSVDYSDRRHIFISGTASINNKGDVVHPQDIHQQILRTIENIQELLKEAEAGLTDVAQMIVYLRDTADYRIVKNYFDKQYTEIPKIIVLAPVCRPGWLIEIECIAIKKVNNPVYYAF